MVRRAGRAAGRAGLGVAVTAAAACVQIETGPNQVVSARVEPNPPSIVLGDVLRDSLGREMRLAAVGFGEGGGELATAPVRFTYLPTQRDSTGRLILDTALVVDPEQGAVRATALRVAPQGVIAVRVGDRLQLLDTLQIVLRPDSAAVADTVLPSLRFSCGDPGQFRATPTPADTLLAQNGSLPIAVTVRSDSAGVRGSAVVRARLVLWSVVQPAVIPTVALPTGNPADTVPALTVAEPTTGARVRLDTTASDGRSVVRLRVLPAGLGPTAFPDSVIQVVVRGFVQPGDGDVRNGDFTVRVRVVRQAAPPGLPSFCR